MKSYRFFGYLTYIKYASDCVSAVRMTIRINLLRWWGNANFNKYMNVNIVHYARARVLYAIILK